MSPWQVDLLDWMDDVNNARADYPEDIVLRWVWRNPRRATALLLGVFCGIPLLIGFGLGAWIF